jgi:hypothetical protein
VYFIGVEFGRNNPSDFGGFGWIWFQLSTNGACPQTDVDGLPHFSNALSLAVLDYVVWSGKYAD